MATILDLPRDGRDTRVVGDKGGLPIIIRDLELVALEAWRVAAMREDLAGFVVAFHRVAGIFERIHGVIVITPVLAGVEAFGGCGGCAKGGDKSEDGGKLHFLIFSFTWEASYDIDETRNVTSRISG